MELQQTQAQACDECRTFRPMEQLVSGTCIFCKPELVSELTHFQCAECGEWHHSQPYETERAHYCQDCKEDLQECPGCGVEDIVCEWETGRDRDGAPITTTEMCEQCFESRNDRDFY